MIGERVSIVVLTFNRRDEVLRTLAQLARVDESVPIIVVDNGSTDATARAIAGRYPRAMLLRLPANIGAAGRNAGVRACTTPYVAFCDDDTWWLPGSLELAARTFDAHPKLAAITARVLVGEHQREDPTNAAMAASPFPNTLGVPGSELLGLLGGACMMRRAAFLQAGGYHPRLFIGCEEALLAVDLMSAGWRMAYIPGVLVCHHPSKLRDARARRRLIARNELWLAWLRRPPASAWRVTRRWGIKSLHEGSLLRNALDALRGLPWVLRERRVAPDHVEAALRMLDDMDAVDSSAVLHAVRQSSQRAPG